MATSSTDSTFFKLYRKPALSAPQHEALVKYIRETLQFESLQSLSTESCFYIQASTPLTTEELSTLHWLLSETFEPEFFSSSSFLPTSSSTSVIEVGPRMHFSTAWSTNACAICHACNLPSVIRIERSRRYVLTSSDNTQMTPDQHSKLLKHIHDRMTETVYEKPLTSFSSTKITRDATQVIPIMEDGKDALSSLNDRMGLGFDDWDLEYYTNLFKTSLKRNPTDVECFDLAQSNSEHSRHWFFGGKMILNGETKPTTLFKMVKQTITEEAKKNSVIAFHDNSSVISDRSSSSGQIQTLFPESPALPGKLQPSTLTSHMLLTAETHNFPSGVAPFPGAETGTGGRIRDVQATGRGAHVMAGISSYAVGNLNIPSYNLPWEDSTLSYPLERLASPLDIQIEASNGASEYGNKFGEPVVTGFSRSFGQVLPDGERREYIKPIMFSAGVGRIDASHCKKGSPANGLYVVKIGGPCYRIGMGGGAASSRPTSSTNDPSLAELDFNAVQRGDAEMENKMNRVIRACIELRDLNPIVSIHDQGAGGNGNVLKEIVEPEGSEFPGGARYNVKKVLIGDETLSILEIWGAEYQENNAILIHQDNLDVLHRICTREKAPYCVLGQVTGDGNVVLYDPETDSTPVNLPLSLVLADMPQKSFIDSTRDSIKRVPVTLPSGLPVRDALDRVLRLLSVASKRFLTTKVDRSVSGLIASQQCVGPLHIPLGNVGVVAQSHFANSMGVYTGVATAVGEQPVKGLVNPGAMARLSVGEALTNLVWAPVTRMEDIKCSANWMWAAKHPGEAVAMYEACEAMRDVMLSLGVSVDGGKDSLSMSANVDSEIVKAPGTLVITTYAPCVNVQDVVTPDLKPDFDSSIVFIDLEKEDLSSLGGTALAQVYSQIGDKTSDMSAPLEFKKAFEATQECVKKRMILAGHDRSDGGLITTLCEMAFAGNVGIDIQLSRDCQKIIEQLFSEGLGLVLQVRNEHLTDVLASFDVATVIGTINSRDCIKISMNNVVVLEEKMTKLRDVWEATGFELDRLQCNPKCVDAEQAGLSLRRTPQWSLSFEPSVSSPASSSIHRVAVLREEGSNGDREMASAFYSAGFEVWDITMTDLVSGKVVIDERFSGIAFVGGFSFADVLGSAKGWAGVIKYHEGVWKQLQAFKDRDDTFSLGVCNGCQLMSLLGWVCKKEHEKKNLPRFITNESGRYESRFVSVKIEESPAVMLRGMEGSSLGVWVSHGEGRCVFPDGKSGDVHAPIRYVNDDNVVTQEYPFNPNGSTDAVAALCSNDGRHLCMMPHPERCFLKYQWPYMPREWKETHVSSPWLRMFQNAKAFCESSSS